MIGSEARSSFPAGLSDDGAKVAHVHSDGTITFGPSFYGFVEIDGSGWAPANVDVVISPTATPCCVTLAMNRVSELAPIITSDPPCKIELIDKDDGEWEMLQVIIGAGVARVCLNLEGASIREPRGSGRELGLRFSPFFSMRLLPTIRECLREAHERQDYLSVFHKRFASNHDLPLPFENIFVDDAFVIGRPGVIAIDEHGTLRPLRESNPYEAFLAKNVSSCLESLTTEALTFSRYREGLSLCGDWSDNFWHWWCEFLPYAVGAWHQGWRGKVFVPSDRALFVDSLALLGIPASSITPKTADVLQVERLLLPRRQRGQYVPEGFQLYKLINALVQKHHAERRPSRKIYIARRSSRVVRNEEEVFGWLALQGFEKVFMEDHSIAEQVALAQQAVAIVGPHGAGMTAALFMPPGGVLIEFFAPVYVNPCMLEVCRDLEHRYAMIVSRIYQDRVYDADSDLDVDMPTLQATVRSLC